MLLQTIHMLRPAAMLRTAVRNVPAAVANPVRVSHSSPSAFVRHSQRFASTSASKLQEPTRSSILQSLGVNSTFRSTASVSSLSSRTWIAAGAATTCVFAPLICARPGSSIISSRRIAYCAAGSPPSVRAAAYDAYGDKNEPLINTREVTFGMVMGLCSGFLFNKLGKLMMLVVGLGFVSLQLLANSGYIQVNWVKVERRFKDQFDVDRDGKVTMNDARHGFRWLIELLTRNFQFKSTFVGGFIMGFRYG